MGPGRRGVPPPVLGRLLLEPEPPEVVFEVAAPGHRTRPLGLAVPGVDLQQRPDAPADLAAACGADLAARAVLQQGLHLGAVLRRAVRAAALACVHQELHVELDRLG